MSKKSVITRIVMGALVVISVAGYRTAVSKGSDAVAYDFDYNEYGEVISNISTFATKETNSSILISSSGATDCYYVLALGSNDTGNVGDNFADASNGYQYWFSGNHMESAELVNFVNEWGYSAAGIKGVFQGDALFHAHGYFTPDMD
jgi:hypothetical protein